VIFHNEAKDSLSPFKNFEDGHEQALVLSDDLNSLFEYSYPFCHLFKKESANDNGRHPEGRVLWKLVKTIRKYPNDLISGSRSIYNMSPDCQHFIDYNRNTK